MTTIEFGQENAKWSQYGLYQHNIKYDGQDTKYRTLERNGKIITISTKQYSILPNEEALKIADKVTSTIGLTPFNTAIKYVKNGEALANHAIIDKETRLNAFYAKQVDEIEREKVFVGLHVFNSIDRSTAFGAGAFTFRVTCQNQVIATLKKLSRTMPQAQTIDYVYQKHTGKAFEEQFFHTITNRMALVCDNLDQIINSYKKMAVTDLTEKLHQELINSNLPSKIRPDYIPQEPQQSVIQVPKLTEWEVYNDITKNIWHNEKTTMQSKQANYNILHQLMPLQVI